MIHPYCLCLVFVDEFFECNSPQVDFDCRVVNRMMLSMVVMTQDCESIVHRVDSPPMKITRFDRMLDRVHEEYFQDWEGMLMLVCRIDYHRSMNSADRIHLIMNQYLYQSTN